MEWISTSIMTSFSSYSRFSFLSVDKPGDFKVNFIQFTCNAVNNHNFGILILCTRTYSFPLFISTYFFCFFLFSIALCLNRFNFYFYSFSRGYFIRLLSFRFVSLHFHLRHIFFFLQIMNLSVNLMINIHDRSIENHWQTDDKSTSTYYIFG